ncbi:Monooxygenase [Metarhizium brunneum]
MDGTVLPSLPELRLHTPRDAIDAQAIVAQWLSQLQKCFEQRVYDDMAHLFIDDCWWRDILGLAWDFTTKQGRDTIGAYLTSSEVSLDNLSPSAGGLKPALVEWGEMAFVQSGFVFGTRHGQGRGLVRLAHGADDTWKAWTVFTQLEELKQSPAVDGANSAAGDAPVLIVGAGQAGVMLGTRLRHMGVPVLLVERHQAVGDAWRSRYDSVRLHTPKWTDQYPFLRYPDNWPEWLGRDRVADFLEHYAQLMDLDILLGTSVTSVRRDGAKWAVELYGPKGRRTIFPQHVVLATGVVSDQPNMPRFPGQDSFKGLVYHSSQRKSGHLVPDVAAKSVVVVGCSTSGHDAAQDFVNCGAKQVSMVQRHPIFCVSSESWKTMQLGLWNMEGLGLDEADVLGNSFPTAVIRTMSIGLTAAMASADAEMLDGLRGAGLAVRTGQDGYGLADHQLVRGGHFYIDQGASRMIVDGRIRVHRCEGGVREMAERSVTLDDGTELEADVVVLATGYRRNIDHVRALMGDEVADRLGGFGDLDGEQERRGWWRPTGVEGFWYMTGSFMWCRQFSQALALQIAADLGRSVSPGGEA